MIKTSSDRMKLLDGVFCFIRCCRRNRVRREKCRNCRVVKKNVTISFEHRYI